MASKIKMQREKINRLRKKEQEQLVKVAAIQKEISEEVQILDGLEKDQVGDFMKAAGMTSEEAITFLKRMKEGGTDLNEERTL